MTLPVTAKGKAATGQFWVTCETHVGSYPDRPGHMRACSAGEAESALASRYGVRRADLMGSSDGAGQAGETTF